MLDKQTLQHELGVFRGTMRQVLENSNADKETIDLVQALTNSMIHYMMKLSE